MGEMTVIVGKEMLLDVNVRIKGLCAELYHHYSKLHKKVPAAANLWLKTAYEEERHQIEFKLALNLTGETEFELSKESLKKAYGIQHRLLHLTDFHTDSRPTVLTAVSRSVEIEESLAALHEQNLLNFREGPLQRLFKALGRADRTHAVAIKNYRAAIHLPLCKTAENRPAFLQLPEYELCDCLTVEKQ